MTSYPFQDHVAMAIKSFDASQQLLVVPAVDEHLRVILHRLSEDGQRTGVELLLFLRIQILLGHVGL